MCNTTVDSTVGVTTTWIPWLAAQPALLFLRGFDADPAGDRTADLQHHCLALQRFRLHGPTDWNAPRGLPSPPRPTFSRSSGPI